MTFDIGAVAIVGDPLKTFKLVARQFAEHEDGTVHPLLIWAGHCALCNCPIISATGEVPNVLEIACSDHWSEVFNRKGAHLSKYEIIEYYGSDPDGPPVNGLIEVYAELESSDDRPPEDKPSMGIAKLGVIEKLVLDVIEQQYLHVESVRYDELIDSCIDFMGTPEEGARDTRRARVLRALKTLAGKNGYLEIVNGRVNFMRGQSRV